MRVDSIAIFPSPMEVLRSFPSSTFMISSSSTRPYSIRINCSDTSGRRSSPSPWASRWACSLPWGDFQLGPLSDPFTSPSRQSPGSFIAWCGIYMNMKVQFLRFGIFVYLAPCGCRRRGSLTMSTCRQPRPSGPAMQNHMEGVPPGRSFKVSDDIRVLTAISWTYIHRG